MIFYLLIGTISVVGNTLVLLVVYRSKQLRHSQYIYNCSIALSDIIWGFFISLFFFNKFINLWSLDPAYIKEEYDPKPTVNKNKINITIWEFQIKWLTLSYEFDHHSNIIESTLFYFVVFIEPITLFVSFISLLFASIDRYVALRFPFKYRGMNSIKIAKISCIFVWILSTVIYTVTYIISIRNFRCDTVTLFQPVRETYCFCKHSSLNQHITATILFILFSLLWTLTFLKLYSLYKNYSRSLSLNRKNKKGSSVEKQLSLVLIFMVISFTFSLTPTVYNHICFYAYDINFKEQIYDENNLFTSVSFLATNSIWNFVIYNLLNKKF